MALPKVEQVGMPAGTVAAIQVVWDDTNNKWVPVQGDANGSVSTGGAAPATGTITTVTAAAADTTILAANANRKDATFFNDSTAVLFLAMAAGTSSQTSYSVQVPAGGYFELPRGRGGVYTGIVKGVWAAANGYVRVTEHT